MRQVACGEWSDLSGRMILMNQEQFISEMEAYSI